MTPDTSAADATANAAGWSLARAMMLEAERLFPKVHDPAQRLLLEQRVLDLVMAGLRTTLITAAVGEDIPADWDATRIGITMRDDESGRRSEVIS